MKKLFILIILLLLNQANTLQAQSKIKATVPFAYLPDKSEDKYNQLVAHKTIPLSNSEFIVLSKSAAEQYAIEKYNADLKKAWGATISLANTETLEAFTANQDAAIVVTHRTNVQGLQQLIGHRINLKNGKLQEGVLLLEAPAAARRAGVATSADGSKIVAYRYHTDGSMQIRNISGSLFNGSLTKIKDVKYNLSDIPAILTADIKVSNTGDQYISLISDKMNRLTVHQYNPNNNQVKVMSVLVGGVFEGQKVYIRDSQYTLMPNGYLYGAVITADEATGKYYSLKAVKFDFEAEDMVFAEEFKFTPAYLAKINAADKSTGTKPTRLEDIYLSDLFLTPEEKLIVVAEKKYTEGGETAPYFAKELHLFAYDEYMNTAWNSVLIKDQKAPASEAFASISYSAYLNGTTLNLITLEEINGKYDLYLRRIDTKTGKAEAPQAVGLNVANDKNIAYVKDFTAWLADKDIVTVVRPSKQADGLKLSRILIK